MVWHPDAVRVPYDDAGAFVKAGAKLCWHTTEGASLPTYSGSAPHFTLNPKTGKLWQHIALNRAAKSLEHPPGTVETNHANVIQVELIGSAAQTPDWPKDDYARIAKLARWIEANAKLPRRCSVKFTDTPHRLSPADWLSYTGHIGHQHVPAQTMNHWDPGAFRIDLVLAVPAETAMTAKQQKWAHELPQAIRDAIAADKKAAALKQRVQRLRRLLGRK
jgi:hypothetical protein